jgi:hypothetical protein
MVKRHRVRHQNFSPVLSVSRLLERRLSNAPCCPITALLPDRREVIMSMSEYEERFRPPAPSIHQIFAATRGRRQERWRWRGIWLVAAIGVLTVTYRLASPHAIPGWTTGHTRTTACQGQRSATMELRV